MYRRLFEGNEPGEGELTTASDEFCFVDEHGRKHDAGLHNTILDNPEADRICRLMSRDKMVARGVALEKANKLFGLE